MSYIGNASDVEQEKNLTEIINDNFQLPEFNDLPMHIKELITNDNIIYNDEMKINKKRKQLDIKNRPIIGINRIGDNNREDLDDDFFG